MESNISSGADGVNPKNISIPKDAIFTAEQIKGLPELNLHTFVSLVDPLGRRIQDAYGIYYLVPILQAGHESRWGNSGLARNHCNLFGITATKSWTDKGKPVANMNTVEFVNGKRIEVVRGFRAYASWLDSFADWAALISGLSIYKKAYELLKHPSTVREGIAEMAKCYATDPAYAKKLQDLYSLVSVG